MRIWQTSMVVLLGTAMVGCGHVNYNSARQAAISEQALPAALAAPPANLDLPKYVSHFSPHVYIRNHPGSVQFYSLDHGWNGKRINIYYVPYADMDFKANNYELHSTYPLQKIATSSINKDGTWSATWKLKGMELPANFFILARTDVGQLTFEEVKWVNKKLLITGVSTPVQ